jgi:transposase-like protein
MGDKYEVKQQFIGLRARGNSYDSIAKKIGISKPTLIKWSSELEMEIANYRAIELEALREEYLASKRHRIILQGEQLKAMRKELAKRDLTDIPTHKLIELVAKLSDNLASDEEPLMFTGEGMQFADFNHQWVG